jgi:S-adenosylmethionine hydrolase
MPPTPILTLTTDFGDQDPYVAAMKGVMLRECPQARIVDLSHSIAPQNIHEAALFLAGSAAYFPPHTIHVVVVDPGVGTARKPVAVAAGGQRFICPDNGVLTLFLREHPLEKAREIANPAFMRENVSATFHGRDIFAPCAARLAAGQPWHEVGPPLDRLVQLDFPEATRSGAGVTGEIIHIDRFGNCVTNIQQHLLRDCMDCRVEVGAIVLDGLTDTYASTAVGDPLALIGSSGLLEIAINRGSAAAILNLKPSAVVRVTLPE